MMISCLAYSLNLKLLVKHAPPKRLLTCNEVHGVICQMMEVFITTGARNLNPTVLEQMSSLYGRLLSSGM
jgi:hypothetical protein